MSPVLASGQMISTLTIGSSTIGRAFATASRNALRPAETNATSFESTGWCLPSYTMTRTSCIGKPAIAPVGEHLLDALLHRRNELVRDHAALGLVDELEAGAARQRLDSQRHLAELAGAAGLLLVPVEALGLAA